MYDSPLIAALPAGFVEHAVLGAGTCMQAWGLLRI